MNIHEYQAKEILKRYGLPIHKFVVVDDKKDIAQKVTELGVTKAVVKVQVHAGGRGKAGGVKVAMSRDEIEKHTADLLGMKLVTKQTGAAGITCHQVMIADLADIEKEYYFGIIIDRDGACPLIMSSQEGGMDIEEVAESAPEKILKTPLTPDGKISDKQVKEITAFMGWEGKTADQGAVMVKEMVKAFMEIDGSILEINPLIKDPDGNLFLLDAKISVDDNALYRQPIIAKMYDPTQELPAEVRAHELDLAYVAMEGNIGCMVNGAGLAMATMDIIGEKGGSPANFLDVGGSATKEKVVESFKIILSDPKVKGILVNIFGGIMKCDIIAEGVVAAVKEVKLKVPLVVRLEGTNVEQGKKILKESGLKLIAANDLGDAAEKMVAQVEGK
ncbi:MAG: Succinate--CoA ligase [ADP-forming] subunit beta [Chlamydiia bacterium]|nr:Succinate--CoA ligase [ADP-forming] subunit beta [Chlamydiia bacterium]MCH9618236.1 Succinate--CoA ligase [ADP-forming] subunit beta [Chlamydiia bacterium]MCH9624301.1 Succinate--CoA ligase [ADP-forming] subunit beta [Chlamydiia bacterium]